MMSHVTNEKLIAFKAIYLLKKHRIANLYFPIVCLLYSSCAPPVYYPTTRNAPMFAEKGEFQGTISNGNNLQMAYAVSNHLGVMTNGMWWSSRYDGKHRFGEAGIGYYSNNAANEIYFDFWGGYGAGRVYVTDTTRLTHRVSIRSFQGTYQKIFLQSGVAYRGRVIHAGFVNRFALLDFSGITGTDSGTPIVFHKTQQFFYEPSIVCKIFIKQFYFTTQLGLNVPIGKMDYRIPFMDNLFAIGVGVRLNFKKEKK